MNKKIEYIKREVIIEPEFEFDMIKYLNEMGEQGQCLIEKNYTPQCSIGMFKDESYTFLFMREVHMGCECHKG